MLIEITMLLSKERVSDKSFFKIKYILRKCRATPMNISCGPRVTSSLQFYRASACNTIVQVFSFPTHPSLRVMARAVVLGNKDPQNLKESFCVFSY